jgi:copper chaperone
MKKNYELAGMSCGGCVNSVKQALLLIPDVKDADVQLNPQRAVITMNKEIGVDKLQAQLKKAGHYTIKEVVLN